MTDASNAPAFVNSDDLSAILQRGYMVGVLCRANGYEVDEERSKGRGAHSQSFKIPREKVIEWLESSKNETSTFRVIAEPSEQRLKLEPSLGSPNAFFEKYQIPDPRPEHLRTA